MRAMKKYKFINKVILNITPPIFGKIYNAFRSNLLLDPNSLFEGNDAEFKKLINECKIYGEYGCGASTIWVAKNTNCKILSADSSREWVNKVIEKSSSNNVFVEYIDVGPVGEWGRPKDYSMRKNFAEYTDSIWLREVKPDLVLIDGRFRVCCFLTVLKYCDVGTKIIFDDYNERGHYHVVEEILRPIKINVRQAIFEVPDFDGIAKANISSLIERFRYVMD